MARLLIHAFRFAPSIGGVEGSTRIMARELAALGQDVTVATATPLDAGAPELDEGYRVLRSDRPRDLLRAAREHDVVIGRGGVSLRAGLAAALAGRPFVAVHEMWGHAAPGLGHTARLGALLRAWLMERAAAHIGVSQAVLGSKALPERARAFVLYNPVAGELWSGTAPGREGRTTDIAFVGRIAASKGVLLLADAIGRMAPDLRPRVTVAGDGPDLGRVKAALAASGGEAEFTGMLSGGRLREVLRSARVVVAPSIKPEGMGMVVAEALASGTPVCVSDQPALVEVAGTAGLVHPRDDAEALARNLRACLTDDALWDRLHAAALVERERFSMALYRARLESHLLPLIAEIRGRNRAA